MAVVRGHDDRRAVAARVDAPEHAAHRLVVCLVRLPLVLEHGAGSRLLCRRGALLHLVRPAHHLRREGEAAAAAAAAAAVTPSGSLLP